ncbi:tyrosine-type recombinase/integrase [Brucella lupini]|uniref:Tyrosine-type recombinase/integrase n=2 Tax=Brucella lupini TaxID=255457 RepID=A0AB34DTZ6_9HYPH|nr:tyrosine-type recombinase/integrase [Brucella lupini]
MTMPRPRKPYIQREVTRHGKTIWYFRRGKEKRIRLPGQFGSKEFNAAYDAALSGNEPPKRQKASHTSLRWLVDQYYASGRYSLLKPFTQRNQKVMLEGVCKTGGDLDFRGIGTDDIRQGMLRREGTPFQAGAYLSIMRKLFEFAVDSGWIKINPTDDVKPKKPKSDGFHTWTIEEVHRYQEKHPVGTQARLALDLMLYTGLRRTDAITLGPQHIKNNYITIRTSKTGAEIIIPLLDPLAKSINATKTGDMVFLITSKGLPWKHAGFGYWFADRCDEALVPGRAHGLRKAGATFAADNGATPFELTAMYGWSSTKMAEVYTRKADRARLAERAANKLFPNPIQRLGSGNKKKK